MMRQTKIIGGLKFKAGEYGRYSPFWHNEKYGITVFRDTARSWELRMPGRKLVYTRKLTDLEEVIGRIKAEIQDIPEDEVVRAYLKSRGVRA